VAKALWRLLSVFRFSTHKKYDVEEGWMSGSGGGSWVSPTNNSCDMLAQHTTLNSPNRDVLKTIKKGDVLDVRIGQAGKAIIVEATKNGNVAGTITSSIIQRLAECIEEGYVYVAEVTENEGGACRVHIHTK
jgi:hypothetical protein